MILSRRLSPSLPQTPLRKSAAYEPELKDLEVDSLHHFLPLWRGEGAD
jgi:hypothetical protein